MSKKVSFSIVAKRVSSTRAGSMSAVSTNGYEGACLAAGENTQKREFPSCGAADPAAAPETGRSRPVGGASR